MSVIRRSDTWTTAVGVRAVRTSVIGKGYEHRQSRTGATWKNPFVDAITGSGGKGSCADEERVGISTPAASDRYVNRWCGPPALCTSTPHARVLRRRSEVLVHEVAVASDCLPDVGRHVLSSLDEGREDVAMDLTVPTLADELVKLFVAVVAVQPERESLRHGPWAVTRQVDCHRVSVVILEVFIVQTKRAGDAEAVAVDASAVRPVPRTLNTACREPATWGRIPSAALLVRMLSLLRHFVIISETLVGD